MTNEQFKKKLSEVQRLREQTVFDIIMSDVFLRKIESRLEAQKQLRRAAVDSIKGGGRLAAHTVDRFLNHTAEQMRDEYLTVTAKTSKRSASERKYIEQLGALAYNDAIREIAVAEFPELEEEFKKRRNGYS